jgi:hypothetical protein
MGTHDWTSSRGKNKSNTSMREGNGMIMRKVQLLGTVLVALCALGVFLTASAFALEFELAQWLANGSFLLGSFGSETAEEFSLENTEAKTGILCSALFEGTLGAEGRDEITKVLNLSGVEVPQLDESGATGGLDCVALSPAKTCETGSEFWPLNLPWVTELKLDKQVEEYYDLFVLNGNGLRPAYAILCLFMGASINELCEMGENSGGKVVNVTGGVEPTGLAEPLGICGGKSGIADITATGGLVTFNDDDTATVSE